MNKLLLIGVLRIIIILNLLTIRLICTIICPLLPKETVADGLKGIQKHAAIALSDIKRYKEIRNLTAGQGYLTGCLLNYECIKSRYRLIAVYFSTQKLVADPKAIQQIDLVE